jgi:hypothetical protein
MFRSPYKILNLQTIVFILLVIVLSCMVLLLKPQIVGDASEYIMMQQSLMNHGSPDFRETDVDSFYQLIKKTTTHTGFLDHWFRDDLLKGIAARNVVAGGCVVGVDGARYSYHFFAYSLLSIPFRVLSDLLGIDPVYSFGILHALLLGLAAGMILRCRRLSFAERFWIAAGFILTCAVFYFNWIHTELFSATFLTMAIVQYLDKRTTTAFVLAAIASLQNQPIALALPLFYLAQGIKNPDKRRMISSLIFPFTNWKQWLLTALSEVIVLLPSFYYLRVYGHANPIAHLKGVSTELISVSRLFSTWFDLNQGIVVGFPGLLAGILILLPVACVSRKSGNPESTWRAVLLLALSLLISIPCGMQGNWNAGCAGMLRYGLWIGIPLFFVFTLLLRSIGNPVKMVIIIGVVLLQLWVPRYCGLPARINYLEFNPFSAWVMNRLPWFYNPDPEIFAERLTGKDGTIWESDVYLWMKNGRIRKLLTKIGPSDTSNQWEDNQFYRKVSPSQIVGVSGGWSYVNGDFEILRSGEYLISYDDDSATWENWSNTERSFRWSLGNESKIRFQFPPPPMTLSGLLRIRLNSKWEQQVGIYLNGQKLFEQMLSGDQELTLQFHPDWVDLNQVNEIGFRVSNARKPTINQDPRILGIQFRGMVFQTISDE